jgi:hypothetical protein
MEATKNEHRGTKRPAKDETALVQRPGKQARHSMIQKRTEAQRVQHQDKEADQVALELLKSYLVTVLDPGSGLGVQVVSEWTRYPPFPDYDPAGTSAASSNILDFSPLWAMSDRSFPAMTRRYIRVAGRLDSLFSSCARDEL